MRPRAARESGCALELTRDEREMLNCLLTVGVQHPEVFGGESATLCRYFRDTLIDIQQKLPLRALPTNGNTYC